MKSKICTKCQFHKPLSEYWLVTRNNGNRVPGAICKECKRKYREIYEFKNRKRLTEKARNKTFQRKQELVHYFGKQCQVCDSSFYQACMDFHHVIDNKNEKGVSYYIQSSFGAAVKEANKCILVCSNCHRLIHSLGQEIHNFCVLNKDRISFEELKIYLIDNMKRIYDESNT